jgi:methylthioribose-1-phosphate isomerase
VQFVVVAPTSTIDHDAGSGDAIPIEERAAEEITTSFPAFNPAFDITPAGLIDAIVTEEGIRRGAPVA